jgi:outer membrane protein TolC
MGNSARLKELIRAGNLYLSAQDAIALALENNIDVEVSRYAREIAQWQLLRSTAGGALPGVPSGASQAGSVASGQGVVGSQSAAGVSGGAGGQNGGRSANATISQVGPVTQTLDPSFQVATTFTHTSSPQANATQSLTSNLVSGSRAYTATYQQGFLTGGNITLGYTDHYLNENAATDLLNPSVAPKLSLSIQQNLLSGFGMAVNSRNIVVSKIGIETSDLNFRKNVSNVTVQVLSAYYSLAADYLELKAKQGALDVARAFEDNVKRQIVLGAAADADLITAQTQTAQAEGDLSDSQAALQQQDLALRNLITRTGVTEPILEGVKIIPLDEMAIPPSDDLPSFQELVQTAIAKRPDLATDLTSERSSETSALGTRNGLLPTLQVVAGTSQAGLAGSSFGGINPYFVGGIGTALGQVFRRNFATNNGGVVFYTQVGNHQAQADFAIDQLQLRQTQLATRRDLAQVEVDVMNSVIALQQARAQFDAAVHNRVLQEQLLTGERRKYAAGASTPFAVSQQERDLTNAQSQELAALVAYRSARINLDATLGTTLEANHISIRDALTGAMPPSAGR